MPEIYPLPWPAGRFEALTFDCYGTLVDWRPGALRAVREVLMAHGVSAADADILGNYSVLETQAEAPPYRPYREALAQVMRGLGQAFGFSPSAKETGALVRSLPEWKPYADTIAALRLLKTRYRLGIISNVDDDLFACTAKLLEIPFDAVVTAQSVASYKPCRRNFETALERLGVGHGRVLHVAQSLYHDVAAVKPMGWATVWVNRYRKGPDAVKAAGARADLEVPDLKTLAELLCRAPARVP